MLRDMCRNFADNELAPHAGEWDKNHTFPAEPVRLNSRSLWAILRASAPWIFEIDDRPWTRTASDTGQAPAQAAAQTAGYRQPHGQIPHILVPLYSFTR